MNYEKNSLAHYGVPGQKWGVRRYQNPDGTLTPEGLERYGGTRDRGDKGLVKKWTLGSESGNYAFAKWRERRHVKNLEKAKNSKGRNAKAIRDIDSVLESDNPALKRVFTPEERNKLKEQREKMVKQDEARRQKKIDKYESKLAAQSAANKNLDAYRRHSSTAKLVMQNCMGFGLGGTAYRHARARGEDRINSLLEVVPGVGTILRMTRDKKAYGKYIVYVEPEENAYYGNEDLLVR